MDSAIKETERRRSIQQKFNEENGITPKTIEKAVREVIEATKSIEEKEEKKPIEMTKRELIDFVKKLEKEMKEAAGNLEFERAALLRDKVFEYKTKI